MKIGCVLMAAGFGRRFGGNKLQVEFDGGLSLIECALSAIPGEKLEQVVVVTQYPEIEELVKKYGFTSLPNPHPEIGQSESIRIGLEALWDCDAVMFQVADQPKLQKETVARHRGNPCIFPSRLYPELMALTGDHGGRSVILTHEEELLLLEVSPSQLLDIDTPEQLQDL